nr:pentatricopeptide repeat protein AaPPR406 [Agave angustifolia]
MNLRKVVLKPTINLSILETHLEKCGNRKQFLQIHAQMTSSGFIRDTYAASRLLNFSTSSHFFDLDYSRQILSQIENPNGFTWNRLMRAYNQRNSPQSCLLLYKLMRQSDAFTDNHTYPIVLQACIIRLSLVEGRMIHTHITKLNFDADVYAVNSLINMYAVCGVLEDARLMFDKSPVLDSVSWNTILAGYIQVDDIEESIQLFSQMPEKNTIASNSMIALFCRTGCVEDARRLFDEMPSRDVVTWTAMMSCYEKNEKFREALEMFVWMHREGILMDEVVMVSVLSACANLLVAREGELIHGLIIRDGLETYVNPSNALINMYSSSGNIDAARLLFDLARGGDYTDQISWNSMIAGYLKCGFVKEAKDVFNKTPQKDLVSWGTMISGYCKHDRFSEALSLFHEMQVGEIMPDQNALVSVVEACAHLFALEQGKWIHAYIRKNRYRVNVFLGTSLVDMYMKFGCVDTALEVFHALEERGISTWNASILGLAMNGLVNEAFEKFSEMEGCGVVPNEITFVALLGACRHVGLVDEGRRYFNSMTRDYRIEPNVKHYGCMVDLLGRAGHIKEARQLIEEMPFEPDAVIWRALLGSCRTHKNVEIAEEAIANLVNLEPNTDGQYVLLSNIYAQANRWDGVASVRKGMRGKSIQRVPGCSSIEVGDVVYEFVAGDKSHPRRDEIYEMLDEMIGRLKEAGYKPMTSLVLQDVDERTKESALVQHSEKLAIAYGLLSSAPKSTIRVVKNLRVCEDCHMAIKLISMVYNRNLIVRDRNRFHHFADGKCSCRDYW